SGLAGIRQISTRQINGGDLTVVRPFLGIWRSELEQYLRGHRLRYREDASNKDLGPLRNRIRHRIIPYLEKALGRNIRQTIWRAAMIAAEEEAWIESELAHCSARELAVRELAELPVALQRRQILHWLRAQDVGEVGFDVVESVRALLDHDSRVAKVNLASARYVRRRAKKLFITD
ncbi:MAG TPA: ATP-binding protein, partial [Chthoniobacterales bacterium]|nr:ATP-binding protein [Chthoniobacterales bacterium]